MYIYTLCEGFDMIKGRKTNKHNKFVGLQTNRKLRGPSMHVPCENHVTYDAG